MTAHYALKAETRDRAGKGVARQLRRDNKTPAVIYGDGKPPVKIALESNPINLEYRKGHMLTSLCDLEIGGQKHLALARDVQLHPVTDIVEHVDFLRVTDKTTITVDVPVHFIGHDECQGLKDRAVLNIVRHDVELVCRATAIPEQIDVNLAGKVIGDAIRISDAKLPAGAKPSIDRNFVIATLQAPKEYVEVAVVAPVSDEEAAKTADGAAAAPADGKAAPAAKADAKK